MVAIAFYSITGQTKKFVVKTGLEAHEIDDAWPQYDMGRLHSYYTFLSGFYDGFAC